MKDGKQWPYIIVGSILFVVFACIATVAVAIYEPVEESNQYMQGYHDTDANYNDIIKARNIFDKKYKIIFDTYKISQKDTVLKYKIESIDGKIVPNAKIKVVMTLPYTSKKDITLENPRFNGKEYIFESIALPKAGRWNIMAKISVGEDFRYYNLKTDTRNTTVIEY